MDLLCPVSMMMNCVHQVPNLPLYHQNLQRHLHHRNQLISHAKMMANPCDYEMEYDGDSRVEVIETYYPVCNLTSSFYKALCLSSRVLPRK